MNTTPKHWICIYCGSRDGAGPTYRAAATALGHALAEAGLGLVYGGARNGLMGALADAALETGAPVLGIMPRGLVEREQAHRGLTELREVETMHERKQAMFAAADGFIAQPGGLGTLEGVFEVLTWQQIGWHDKPIGLLDVGGYYQPLLGALKGMCDLGFLKAETLQRIIVSTRSETMIQHVTEQLQNLSPLASTP